MKAIRVQTIQLLADELSKSVAENVGDAYMKGKVLDELFQTPTLQTLLEPINEDLDKLNAGIDAIHASVTTMERCWNVNQPIFTDEI